ncbi:MAG: extracellular solute-binding protein [Lachnospiraceae bacterium]|nr:extracellular solute-binding protein [Lachnospiraceae bacterium]
MNKIKIFSVLLVLSMLYALVGCSNKNDVEVSEIQKAEPIEVIWWNTLDAQHDETIEGLIAQFNSEHSDIVIIPEYIGNWNELNEKIIAANAAGTGLPGIAVCNTKFIASYAENNLFEDLNYYIEKDDFDTSDFVERVFNTGKFNNKQIAFPFLHNTQVIYYNKTVAEDNNLEIPIEFSEWDDFFNDVYSRTGMTPLSMQSLDFYYGCIYRSHGVKILTVDNKCDLNSDIALSVTTQFSEWCKEELVQWLQGTDASANMRQSFYDENTFMVFHNSSALPDYIDNCNFEVGIAWYPYINGANIADLGGSVIGIPSKNDQTIKDAAWEFIKFLSSTDVSTTLDLEAGCIPIRYSALDSSVITEYITEYPAYQILYDHLDNINPPIIHKSASEIVKVWQNYTNQIMIEGADVKEMSDQMVNEIEAIIAD